jgi:hypothetical protein
MENNQKPVILVLGSDSGQLAKALVARDHPGGASRTQ